MITAHVSYRGEVDDLVQVETSTGHSIQFGGRDGDGFCYAHQSFDCLDRLSAEERVAVEAA